MYQVEFGGFHCNSEGSGGSQNILVEFGTFRRDPEHSREIWRFLNSSGEAVMTSTLEGGVEGDLAPGVWNGGGSGGCLFVRGGLFVGGFGKAFRDALCLTFKMSA